MTPAWLAWARPSQWVAAWVAMVNTSSLKATNSGSGPTGSLTWIIVKVGWTRPSTNPSWIPSASDKGSPSPNALPVTTAAAPRRRAASSMRLRVPISSSGPHRPQLRTRAAMSVNTEGAATARTLTPDLPRPRPGMPTLRLSSCSPAPLPRHRLSPTGRRTILRAQIKLLQAQGGIANDDGASSGVHGVERALEDRRDRDRPPGQPRGAGEDGLGGPVPLRRAPARRGHQPDARGARDD